MKSSYKVLRELVVEKFYNMTNSSAKTAFELIGLKIDPCLEKLLNFHGFDSVETLKLVTGEVLHSIEIHAQADLPKLIDEQEYDLYYGSRCK